MAPMMSRAAPGSTDDTIAGVDHQEGGALPFIANPDVAASPSTIWGGSNREGEAAAPTPDGSTVLGQDTAHAPAATASRSLEDVLRLTRVLLSMKFVQDPFDRVRELLSSASEQTVNKIVRRCITSLKTPWEALGVTMKQLEKELKKQSCAAELDWLANLHVKYPELLGGMVVLANLPPARVAPHQYFMHKDGSVRVVTLKMLRGMLDNLLGVKPGHIAAHQVISCLDDLATQLNEPLFVNLGGIPRSRMAQPLL